jgi:hypothetical protein
MHLIDSRTGSSLACSNLSSLVRKIPLIAGKRAAYLAECLLILMSRVQPGNTN